MHPPCSQSNSWLDTGGVGDVGHSNLNDANELDAPRSDRVDQHSKVLEQHRSEHADLQAMHAKIVEQQRQLEAFVIVEQQRRLEAWFQNIVTEQRSQGKTAFGQLQGQQSSFEPGKGLPAPSTFHSKNNQAVSAASTSAPSTCSDSSSRSRTSESYPSLTPSDWEVTDDERIRLMAQIQNVIAQQMGGRVADAMPVPSLGATSFNHSKDNFTGRSAYAPSTVPRSAGGCDSSSLFVADWEPPEQERIRLLQQIEGVLGQKAGMMAPMHAPAPGLNKNMTAAEKAEKALTPQKIPVSIDLCNPMPLSGTLGAYQSFLPPGNFNPPFSGVAPAKMGSAGSAGMPKAKNSVKGTAKKGPPGLVQGVQGQPTPAGQGALANPLPMEPNQPISLPPGLEPYTMLKSGLSIDKNLSQSQSTNSTTLQTHLQALSGEDPRCVFIVRKVNRLGFRSGDILTKHFSTFDTVVKVLVAHSKVKRGQGKGSELYLRPGSLGFVVMKTPESVDAILTSGPEITVQGLPIRVQPFWRVPRVGEEGGVDLGLFQDDLQQD